MLCCALAKTAACLCEIRLRLTVYFRTKLLILLSTVQHEVCRCFFFAEFFLFHFELLLAIRMYCVRVSGVQNGVATPGAGIGTDRDGN